MKQTLRRLIALILAMSMAFSLLSTSVWATGPDESLAPQSSAEAEPQEAEPEESDDADESEEAEEADEDTDKEEAQEAEPEDQKPEAEPETSEEDKQEPADTDDEDEQEPADTDDEDDQEPEEDADTSEDEKKEKENQETDDADKSKDEDADVLSTQDASPVNPTPKTGLAYNDEEQQLVNAGSVAGGDVYYFLTEDVNYVPTKNEDGWVTNASLVRAKNCGTYYIHYYFKVGSAETGIASFQTKIAQAPVIPKEKEDDIFVHTSPAQVAFEVSHLVGTGQVEYNGSEQEPDLLVSISYYDENLDYTKGPNAVLGTDYTISYLKGTEPISKPKDVGMYTAVITPTGNFKLFSQDYPITIPFEIVKKQYILSVTVDPWTYGTTANTPTVDNVLSGGQVTIAYKKKTDPDTEYSSEVPKQVGLYTVRATTPATSNYEAAEGFKDVRINKRTLIVTANAHSIQYGDEASNNGVTYSNFAAGDNASVLTGAPGYTYNYTKGDKVGNYDITPTEGTLSASNYRFTCVTGPLTVTKRQITVKPGDQTVTYGTPIDQSKVTGSPMPEGLGDKVTATLTPSTTNVTGSTPGTITPSNIKVLDKDGKDVSDNYDITTDTGTLNVTPKKLNSAPTVTLKLPDEGYTYDGTSHKPGAPGDPGTVEVKDPDTGKVIDPSDYDLIYTKKNGTDPDDCINAGNYTVKVQFKDNGNYAGSPNGSADYPVKKRPVKVAGPTVLVPYKGSVPDVSADQCSVTTDSLPMVTGDGMDLLDLNLSGKDLVDTTKAAGTTTELTLSKGNNASGNYDVTLVPGNYTISPAPAAIIVPNTSTYEYDGTTRAPAIEVLDKRNVSNPIDLLKQLFGGEKEAKVYYSTSTPLNQTNYKTAGTTDNVAGPDVGETTVYYYVEFPAGNYERDPVDGNGGISGSTTVKITPKQVTVTAKDQNISATGSVDKSLSQVTAEGLVGTDVLADITLEATPEPGKFTPIRVSNAKVSNGHTGNYTFVYNYGKLGTKAAQDAPDVNVKDQQPKTITIKPDPGVEYIISKDPNLNPTDNDFKPGTNGYFKPDGDNPADHTFENLDPDTPYYIYARKPAEDPKADDPSTPEDESSPGKDASPVTKQPTATTPEPPDPPTAALNVDYIYETVKPSQSNYELKAPGQTSYTDQTTDIDPGDLVKVRVKKNGNIPASPDAEVTLKTRPDAPDAVSADDLERGNNSITVTNAKPGQVYLIKEMQSGSVVPPTKADWLNAGKTPAGGRVTFDGLETGKQYAVFTRYPADQDAEKFASKNSKGTPTSTKMIPAAPQKPNPTSDDPYEVDVPVKTGEEYRLERPDGTLTDWVKPQPGATKVTFNKNDGVVPDKEFKVYARLYETDDTAPSEPSAPGKVTPQKKEQKAQAPVVQSTTPDSITIKTNPGEQYSIDGGKTWTPVQTTSGTYTFPNLTPGKEYGITAKKPETDTYKESPIAGPTKATPQKEPQTAKTPVIASTTPTTVTVKTNPGERYSIDGGKTWTPVQTTSGTYTFPNKKPNTTYEVIAQKPETATKKASKNAGPTEAKTPKENQAAPKPPVIHGTDFTTITVVGRPGEEYSIDGGKTWKKPTDGYVTFDKLTQGKEYPIVARFPETDTKKASPASQPTKAKTKKMTEEEVINRGLEVSQTAKQINIKWGKLSSASGYDVYVQYCGSKFKDKPDVTTNKPTSTNVKVTKVNGKAIDLKRNFKVYVRAFKLVKGKKVTITKTLQAHVVGRLNTKFTNVNGIKLDNYSFIIKKGKTAKITGKVLLVDPKRKQLSDEHAAQFRFSSSNKKVATVDASGKITAKAKGTCTVFVYARNGYAKEVKVQVQ